MPDVSLYPLVIGKRKFYKQPKMVASEKVARSRNSNDNILKTGVLSGKLQKIKGS